MQRCLLGFLIILPLLTVGALAEPSCLPLTKIIPRSSESDEQSLACALRSVYAFTSQLTRHRYVRAITGCVGGWGVVQLMALCSLIGACGIWRKRRTAQCEGYAATGSNVKRIGRSVLDGCNTNSLGEYRREHDTSILHRYSPTDIVL